MGVILNKPQNCPLISDKFFGFFPISERKIFFFDFFTLNVSKSFNGFLNLAYRSPSQYVPFNIYFVGVLERVRNVSHTVQPF